MNVSKTQYLSIICFQIPDQARVAPSSSDPKSKFFELIQVRLYLEACSKSFPTNRTFPIGMNR